MSDFWVFGYGSLMWNPGFAHVEKSRARLAGFRRALCVRSWVHRGTQEHPGLVLGLDRGGSCVGLAFRVPGKLEAEVMSYLRQRELVTNVYVERRLRVQLDSGQKVEAVVYVCDRAHQQYAGALGETEASDIVRAAYGKSGDNISYVMSTIEHLKALGIRDQWLENVGRRISAIESPHSGLLEANRH